MSSAFSSTPHDDNEEDGEDDLFAGLIVCTMLFPLIARLEESRGRREEGERTTREVNEKREREEKEEKEEGLKPLISVIGAEDVSGHSFKALFNVCRVFCGGLEEGNLEIARQGLDAVL